MNAHTASHTHANFWSTHFSHQASRRALVYAWLLSCAGFFTLAVFEITGAIWFVAFAIAFAADIALYMATYLIADRRTSTLDERQQAVRDRAYVGAYHIVLALVALGVGGAMLCFTTGTLPLSQWLAHPAQHPAVLTGFGVIALQLVSLLPTAIIAWNEADAPVDME